MKKSKITFSEHTKLNNDMVYFITKPKLNLENIGSVNKEKKYYEPIEMILYDTPENTKIVLDLINNTSPKSIKEDNKFNIKISRENYYWDIVIGSIIEVDFANVNNDDIKNRFKMFQSENNPFEPPEIIRVLLSVFSCEYVENK